MKPFAGSLVQIVVLSSKHFEKIFKKIKNFWEIQLLVLSEADIWKESGYEEAHFHLIVYYLKSLIVAIQLTLFYI